LRCLSHCLAYRFNLAITQLRIHRQAQQFAAELLGDGQAERRIIGVSGLEVDRDRIEDGRAYASAGELLPQFIALGVEDDVLMIHSAGRRKLDTEIGKGGVIRFRDSDSAGVVGVQMLKLHSQDGGL
jgi:hypothetical protein